MNASPEIRLIGPKNVAFGDVARGRGFQYKWSGVDSILEWRVA